MSLDTETVRRIARLARIRIDDTQIEAVRGELNGILGWVEQLAEVDVTGVQPLTGAADMVMRLREDVVDDAAPTGGARADAVLANAPDRAGNFYAVPKVVE